MAFKMLRTTCGVLFAAMFGAGGAIAADDAVHPGTNFKDCEHCPEMVVLPAGSFVMGSSPDETTMAKVRHQDAGREWPQRTVTLSQPFAIGKYEVTIGEWRAFVEATNRPDPESCTTWTESTNTWGVVEGASWHTAGFYQGEDHPAGCLDLQDVRDYAAWLSEETGSTYRLPTEAEWEYAARGGTATLNTWGNTMEDMCRFTNTSDLTRADVHGGFVENPTRYFNCRDGFVYTSPVGAFPPNAYGLHDMVGNIWEWVEDCFIVGYEGAPTDGSARYDANNCDRLIVRGGGWYARNWFMRPAGRSREYPDYRATTLGVRLVKELD
ncbi:MAG: formylglycine-generating enzyme family protein [Rhodospirillaceae bacterium]